MDRRALSEVFNQILEGYDIPKPSSVLRIKAENAALKHPDVPYSLLTNLAHANLWQQFWLNKLRGGRKSSSMIEWKNDFRVPDPSEWLNLRGEFLDGLGEAKRICDSEPFNHQCSNDDEAVETLVRIAVHGAYHCGQMKLLKRI